MSCMPPRVAFLCAKPSAAVAGFQIVRQQLLRVSGPRIPSGLAIPPPGLGMGVFEYVSVLTSIVIGLAIAHLLSGVIRIIQHPGRRARYLTHLVWVAFMFFQSILLRTGGPRSRIPRR